MTRHSLGFLATLFGLLALACGSPPSDPDGGIDEPTDAASADAGASADAHVALDGGATTLDLATLPARLAEVACEGLRACEQPDVMIEARCAGIEAWARDGLVPALEGAIAEDRVRLNGAGLEACLASLEDVAWCDWRQSTPAHWIGRCREVFTGTLAAGEACGFDWECASTLHCAIDIAECGGACAPGLGDGEWCEDDIECAEGLECGISCGEPFGPPTVREPEIVGVGEVCSPFRTANKRCEDGLFCAYDAATDTHLCRAAEPLAEGAPCVSSFPDLCAEGLFCSAGGFEREGHCLSLPGEGEECLSFTFMARCAPGLGCDSDIRCAPRVALGEPCMSDEVCWSGLCAWGGGGCVPPSCIER